MCLHRTTVPEHATIKTPNTHPQCPADNPKYVTTTHHVRSTTLTTDAHHRAYVYTPYACNDATHTCTQGESEIEASFAAVESGSTVTDEQLEAIWAAVDVNGDGVLGPSGDNKVKGRCSACGCGVCGLV